jgi:TPR repeat protein
VPPNNAEALKWYLLAANQGDVLAQYNVGMRYYEGHSIKPDAVLAYKWLSLSAAQNLPDAARALESLSARMSRDQLNQARELIRQFKITPPKNP